MTRKRMRWALRAAEESIVTPGFPLPEKAALANQRAAAPLMAVVRAARDLLGGADDVTFVRVDGGENKLAAGFANLRRAMPAALKAMEKVEPE